MKVLQVNCVYKTGSTGKITYDLHKGLLSNNIESVVCYGRGKKKVEPFVYKTCPEWYSKLNNAISRVTGVMYGGCIFSTNRLISIIKKENPDIVHLQCINGYFVNIYRILTWLKKHNVKTVLTLHAEFMYTGGCGHSLECEQWKEIKGCGSTKHCPQWRSETKSIFFDGTNMMWRKMYKAFEGFDNMIVVSVSPWLKNRAKQSIILKHKHHEVVLNGLDISIFHPYDTNGMRKELGLENKTIVFHASPYFTTDPNHFKGGYYICELARRLPDIEFIVAGYYVDGISVPKNVSLLGKITDQNLLAKYYSMADVTVLTSKRETFSMVTAESLCCGTPVVGFKAGGPEMIALSEMSSFIEYGDVDGMIKEIRKFKNIKLNKSCCAIARYSTQHMLEEYISIYLSLCN